MNQELVKIETQLQQTDKEKLSNVFTPMLELAKAIEKKAFSIIVTDANQVDLIAEARELRLKLKKIRCDAKKEHDNVKEYSKLFGKACDGRYNEVLFCTQPSEKHLQEQEDFAKLQEEKRKAELNEKRCAELEQYEIDTQYFDLGNMPEPGYQQLLKSSKATFEHRKAEEERIEKERIEAEKAEKAEQERIRKERDKLLKEQEKQAKSQAEKEKQAKIEREKQEAILQKEREEKAKLEAEIRAREEKERKEKEAKIEAERQAKLAPDKVKLEKLSGEIAAFKMPEVTSEEAKTILKNVVELLNKTSNYIKEQSLKL